MGTRDVENWDGIQVISTHTFEAQWGAREQWVRSAGRWDTQEQAANAAAEWLRFASTFGIWPAVKVISMTEMMLLEAYEEEHENDED